MNYSKIDELLFKYFEGDSSLKEEEELKRFFSGENVPVHLRKYEAIFKALDNAGKEDFLDESFDQQFLLGLEDDSKRSPKIGRNILYSLLAAAAVFILGLVIFVPSEKIPGIGYFSNKIEDTFDNPKDAYVETVKALMTISSKLNAGTREMDKIAMVNEQMQAVSKMEKINTSMVEVSNLSRIDEGRRDMNKLNKLNTSKQELDKMPKLTQYQIKINNL